MANTNSKSADLGQTQPGRFGALRERTSGATDRLNGSVDGSPLVALAAGVVVGAVAGALLPRTDRETELLGPVGSKIGQAAAEAARAARDAGKQELGILAENKSPLEMVVEKAVGAVSAAGNAAGSAAASRTAAWEGTLAGGVPPATPKTTPGSTMERPQQRLDARAQHLGRQRPGMSQAHDALAVDHEGVGVLDDVGHLRMVVEGLDAQAGQPGV